MVGHAHNDSTDSENVVVCARTECAIHLSFVSKKCWEIKAFLYPCPEYSWKTSQPEAQQMEKFGSARLGRKKEARFLKSRKPLPRGYKLKKPNTTDMERDLQRPKLSKSIPTLRHWRENIHGMIELFFFFLPTILSQLKKCVSFFFFFAFQVIAKLVLERNHIFLAKFKHVICCSLCGELDRRARLSLWQIASANLVIIVHVQPSSSSVSFPPTSSTSQKATSTWQYVPGKRSWNECTLPRNK